MRRDSVGGANRRLRCRLVGGGVSRSAAGDCSALMPLEAPSSCYFSLWREAPQCGKCITGAFSYFKPSLIRRSTLTPIFSLMWLTIPLIVAGSTIL